MTLSSMQKNLIGSTEKFFPLPKTEYKQTGMRQALQESRPWSKSSPRGPVKFIRLACFPSSPSKRNFINQLRLSKGLRRRSLGDEKIGRKFEISKFEFLTNFQDLKFQNFLLNSPSVYAIKMLKQQKSQTQSGIGS